MKQRTLSPKTRSDQKPSPRSPFLSRLRRWEWLIVLAALICDWNSWGHRFVMDDLVRISDNPTLQSPRRLATVFFRPFNPGEGARGDLFRPMTTLSYAANVWFSGYKPESFHIVNRGLHILNCLGIFWMLRRLIPKPPAVALATSLLFAVHPVQTEAITYISGRADALATFFCLFAWLIFIRLRSAPDRKKTHYALSLLFYMFAMLSKESAIPWLAIALLMEWVYFSKENRQQFFSQLRVNFFRVYAGYFGVALLYLIFRFVALGKLAAMRVPFLDNPLLAVKGEVRLLTALKILFQYLGQLIGPVHFSADYYFDQIPMVRHWTDPLALGVLGLSLLLVGFVVWSFYHARHLLFGLGFFLLTYFIVSNLVVLIGTIRGDRLMYLPSLGIFLVAGTAFASVEERLLKFPAKIILWAFGAVVLILLGARTIARNADWRDGFTLAFQTARVSPRSSSAHRSLGLEYYNRKEFDRAMEQFRIAESIYAEYPELMNDIGLVLMQQGKTEQAIPYFRRAVAMAPFYPAIRNNLAVALGAHGDFAEAKAQYEMILRRYDDLIRQEPSNADYHYNKANALYLQGQLIQALEEYKTTLQIDPDYTLARRSVEVLQRKLNSGQ